MRNPTIDPAKRTTICDQVRVALRRIRRAMDLHSRFLIQRHGLSGPQLHVLHELGAHKEMAAGEIAAATSHSHPTVTGILDRLEQKGLVRRRRDSEDRRRVLVAITARGLAILAAPLPLLQDSFVQRFTSLPQREQRLILTSLQRVVAMMEPGGELRLSGSPKASLPYGRGAGPSVDEPIGA